ncbi:2-C-methyl-D-erythritol 4-phosphate cytidylyltransferase [Gilvimarinus agarilyticus]|uniref:2-C-methyl-D-erythritol 4-phosphate cytidylyltransferase n=1 Tax=unclassified Gilvimarinus TaxID=2642066 RepID=UPI001C091C79|nr:MULTISPECIES: 2-C-methyl-D-erythritol 4-phosphate cytidylyltransferase [unclassified Gilvimarinus]MBU2886157.1 2-C-methyl-D-erythritol 4-phosphate cytidylyltransferase [Gilvimarinus agarilyticus]MDO6570867.1 2-C-methyl-D-erythritol 4-phosphate cytidylyltransferase [Gilvimarinus sp. 2_MG-2023]MDO6747035.1 2-C-methyl-D-erythritol 4-phosphate cytidylyltransferase [Gilvimarinus sp. 1_MG-2023]
MSESATYWAVVPAAGVGKRLGGAIPKQYQRILGKTLLEHTLDKLLAVSAIEKIIVALSPVDTYWSELSCRHHARIATVIGGQERADSVLSALNGLPQDTTINHWVLVHDAARPCVVLEDIHALMANPTEQGAILATPVSDTVKSVRGKDITATVDRTALWSAQTPQMFPLHALRQALTDALAQKRPVTDEASAMELAGWQPQVVAASRHNIKVTHPEDLALAELILTNQLKG